MTIFTLGKRSSTTLYRTECSVIIVKWPIRTNNTTRLIKIPTEVSFVGIRPMRTFAKESERKLSNSQLFYNKTHVCLVLYVIRTILALAKGVYTLLLLAEATDIHHLTKLVIVYITTRGRVVSANAEITDVCSIDHVWIIILDGGHSNLCNLTDESQIRYFVLFCHNYPKI